MIRIAYHKVGAALGLAGYTVTADEGAVQDDERQPFVPASLKDVGKFGRLGGQNTDGFAKVTAGGGPGDARIASQAVHTGVIAEPARHEDRLAEGAQGSRAPRRADLSSTGAQKPGQILDDGTRNIEHGGVVHHVKPLTTGTSCGHNTSYQGFTCCSGPAPDRPPTANTTSIDIIEKTSLSVFQPQLEAW
ncbi:hypothetical protein [Streptomyces flavofungini]|uniref:hypothetical protein n=1 Tax=Streptomyces flavofungini TaxID=68200 RepID=UPI001E349F5B|nr:hypothetical protein [Streptomyces flavofungini]